MLTRVVAKKCLQREDVYLNVKTCEYFAESELIPTSKAEQNCQKLLNKFSTCKLT